MAIPLTRTGVPVIDSTVGGILTHQLTLVAGDPGAGKTWVALGFACAALERDESVHYLTDTPLHALYAQAAKYLGRDLGPHLRSGRLTLQILEPGGAHPFPELSSRLRGRGVRNLVLDPIDALLRPSEGTGGIERALVQELVALGVTCLATTPTEAGARTTGGKHAAARASAQFELVERSGERILWVREALWSPHGGEAFSVDLVPGVGAMPGPAVEAPPSHDPAIAGELHAYLTAVVDEPAPMLQPVFMPLWKANEAVGDDAQADAPAQSWVQPSASPTTDGRVLDFRQLASAAPAPAAADGPWFNPHEAEPDAELVPPGYRTVGEKPSATLPAGIALPDAAPRRLLLLAFVLVAGAFLAWRASLLLEAEHASYSIAFFTAEVVALLVALWCYYLMAAPRRASEPPRPDASTTVDVLILTYNEDLDLVRHTILAAREMDEPHSVWVCDDGRRDDLAKMCREMRVGYITRPNNAHYKAGNINNALAHTSGDLVLILDADHVPRQTLLTRLMGYFRDPAIAHVQLPQIYYNVDSFQHSLAIRRAATWHESSIFHHGIMHGLASMNATCFLGTGALMRRSALAEIGGVATGNITEDVLTGMRLHARGHKSVFVDEPLAMLLAPDTALAYAQQRLRWAQGNLEILRTENPLFLRGLTWRQRVAYFNTFGFYLLSYVYLLIYLVPGIYLFTGVAPLSVDDPYNVAIVAAFTVAAILNYLAMAAPHARLFHCECFKLLNLPINLRASMALLNPGGRAFQVTPKGFHIGLPLWVLVPIAVICLVNLAGLGYGVALLTRGDGYLDALLLASCWAGFYGVASALTLAHTISRRAAREPYSVPVSIAARLRTDKGELVAEARMRRLCHELAYLEVIGARLAAGTKVTLQLSQPAVTMTGHISSHGSAGGGAQLLRIDLEPMTRPDWDALSQYLFESANPTFLAGLVGGCTTRLPPAAGEPARSMEQGIDFLPLRSEIV